MEVLVYMVDGKRYRIQGVSLIVSSGTAYLQVQTRSVGWPPLDPATHVPGQIHGFPHSQVLRWSGKIDALDKLEMAQAGFWGPVKVEKEEGEGDVEELKG